MLFYCVITHKIVQLLAVSNKDKPWVRNCNAIKASQFVAWKHWTKFSYHHHLCIETKRLIFDYYKDTMLLPLMHVTCEMIHSSVFTLNWRNGVLATELSILNVWDIYTLKPNNSLLWLIEQSFYCLVRKHSIIDTLKWYTS